MYDFITNLLNLDKSRIKCISTTIDDNITRFHIVLLPQSLECPFCHGKTYIHGYSKPKFINHPILTQRKSIIVYKPLRYRCKDCHKTFLEDNPFTFSTFKNSFFALSQIMIDLSNLNFTYSDIAKKNHVSITTVQRYVDSFLIIPRQSLPLCLGIDEIYSKMAHYGNSKYLCVLVDNDHRTLVEILPSRAKLELSRYFEKIPQVEREKVKYVTMDMWQPYKDIVLKYLKNAAIAVDPFHVIKHLMNGFTRLRLNILNQLDIHSDAYYLLKNWKDLLERDVFLDNKPIFNKRFNRYLNKRDLLELILSINENLALAYQLKEMYRDFNKHATLENCEEWFTIVLNAFIDADLPEYRDFISTILNWKVEILNSFHRPVDNRKLSNALSESINGKIRTYLSVSNGVVNFIRFRKRMLYCLNYKIYYSITKHLRSNKYSK